MSALSEALDNAVEYTYDLDQWDAQSVDGSGKRVVKLLWEQKQQDHLKWAIIIRDSGSGMTKDQLNKWGQLGDSQGKLRRHRRVMPFPFFCSSNISQFGVGGKYSIMHLGNKVVAETTAAGSTDIHKLTWDAVEMRKQTQESRRKGVTEDNWKVEPLILLAHSPSSSPY